MRVAPEILLTDEGRDMLKRLSRSKRTSVRLALRARIVLLAASGWQNRDIATELDIGRVQVARRRERYAESRLRGIARDLPRGAPPARVDVARLVELATRSKPEAATHWKYAHDGYRAWHQCRQRLAALARERTQAAPRTRLQGLA